MNVSHQVIINGRKPLLQGGEWDFVGTTMSNVVQWGGTGLVEFSRVPVVGPVKIGTVGFSGVPKISRVRSMEISTVGWFLEVMVCRPMEAMVGFFIAILQMKVSVNRLMKIMVDGLKKVTINGLTKIIVSGSMEVTGNGLMEVMDDRSMKIMGNGLGVVNLVRVVVDGFTVY